MMMMPCLYALVIGCSYSLYLEHRETVTLVNNKTWSLSSSPSFYSRLTFSVSTSCNFSVNHLFWPLKRYFQSTCLDNPPELELFIVCLYKRYYKIHGTHHNDVKQAAITRLIDNKGLYPY